ncbi:MAG: GAF domain-containing protein [Candidatus Promineofilum sp.]|nr:GAF domain-containing protein [Promineifilum sp.]
MEPKDEAVMPPEEPLAEQLQKLLRAIELGGRAVLPSTNKELLQSIVNAAARIFGAAAAAILLVDEVEQMLVFHVEFGNKQPGLIGRRIPLNKGIAGYVAMTGQAIAVSNVQQDTRFNADFAKSTGYVPDSILAAPLLLGEQVIGVLEVLDKIEAASFGMHDMELMGLFAQQAALAICESQQLERIDNALRQGLRRLASDEGLPDSSALIAALEDGGRDGPDRDDLLLIAGAFNDISRLGPVERRAALKILAALAEVGRARTKPRSRFA